MDEFDEKKGQDSRPTGAVPAVEGPLSLVPEDTELDLEKIIQEAKSENWGAEYLAEEPADSPAEPTKEDAFKDDEFRDTFGGGEGLEQVFDGQEQLDPSEDAPPAESESPETPTDSDDADPLEKGRPKRKQGYGFWGLPHLAATAIWLGIIIVIGVSVARLVWQCAADVLAFGRDPVSATITIEADDSIEEIAQKLKDAGLIDHPDLFVFYANFTKAQEKIKPGVYFINPADAEKQDIVYDYMALVDLMSPHQSGQVVVSGLRIPEGYTCAQIFRLLEDKNICTVEEMESYISGIDPENPDAVSKLNDYWFLTDVQWGHKYSLEGYLFPDTYDFYENDEPRRVIEKMLNSFNANFNDVMKEKLEGLEGYDIRDVIIIASMIEKETANQLESFKISSVIYNRLNKPDKYPYLNIDATLVYALGGKSDLTAEDKLIDSPYNTYTNRGLPPGPISSPSQNSIGAALDPEETEFYFYALDPEAGEHHFSKTYEEHLEFLESLED